MLGRGPLPRHWILHRVAGNPPSRWRRVLVFTAHNSSRVNLSAATYCRVKIGHFQRYPYVQYDKRVELEYHRVLTFTPDPWTPTKQTLFVSFTTDVFYLSLICLVLIIVRPPHRIIFFDIWYFYSNNPDEKPFFSLIEKSCWGATVQTWKNGKIL
jgi:hypothetical protein